MNMLMGATPTEQILSFTSFHCSFPTMPIDNHNGRHYDEMIRYQNNMELYRACNECKSAQSDLRSAKQKVDSAQFALRSAQRRIPELHQEQSRIFASRSAIFIFFDFGV